MAKFNGDDVQVAGKTAAVRFTSRADIVECRLLERATGPKSVGRVIGFGKGPDRNAALAAATADCQSRGRVAS